MSKDFEKCFDAVRSALLEVCSGDGRTFNEDGDDAYFLRQHCETIDSIISDFDVRDCEVVVSSDRKLRITLQMNMFVCYESDDLIREMLYDLDSVSFRFVDSDTVAIDLMFGTISLLGVE